MSSAYVPLAILIVASNPFRFTGIYERAFAIVLYGLSDVPVPLTSLPAVDTYIVGADN